MGFIKRSSPASPAASSSTISFPTDISHTSWKNLRRPLSIISNTADPSRSKGTNQHDQQSFVSPTTPPIPSGRFSPLPVHVNSLQPQTSAPRPRHPSAGTLNTAIEAVSSLKLSRASSPKKQKHGKYEEPPSSNSDSKSIRQSKRKFFSRHSKQRSLTIGAADLGHISLDKPNNPNASKRLSKYASMSFDRKTITSSPSLANVSTKLSLSSISSPISSAFSHQNHFSKNVPPTENQESNILYNHSSASLYSSYLDSSSQKSPVICPPSPLAFPLPVAYPNSACSPRFPSTKHFTPQSPSTPLSPSVSVNSTQSYSPIANLRGPAPRLNVDIGDVFMNKENILTTTTHRNPLEKIVELGPKLEKIHSSPKPNDYNSATNYNYDDDDDSYIVEGIDNSIGQWIATSNSDGVSFPSINNSSVGSGSAPGSACHSIYNGDNNDFRISQRQNFHLAQQQLDSTRSRSPSRGSQISVSLSLNETPLANLNKSVSFSRDLPLSSSASVHSQHNQRSNGHTFAFPKEANALRSASSPISFPPLLLAASTATTPSTLYTASEDSFTSSSPVSCPTSDDDEYCCGIDKFYTKDNELCLPKSSPCKRKLSGNVQIVKTHGIVWIGESHNNEVLSTDTNLLEPVENEKNIFDKKPALLEQPSLTVSMINHVGTLAPKNSSVSCSSAACLNSAANLASSSSIPTNIGNPKNKNRPKPLNFDGQILINDTKTKNDISQVSKATNSNGSVYLTSVGNSSKTSLTNKTANKSTTSVNMSPLQSSFSPISSCYIWEDETASIFTDDDEDNSGDNSDMYSFHMDQHCLYQNQTTHISSKPLSASDKSLSPNTAENPVFLNSQTTPLQHVPSINKQQYNNTNRDGSSLYQSTLQPELKIEGSKSFGKTEHINIVNHH